MNGIFMESNESMGLLYNRYKDIPKITSDFINDIDSLTNEEWDNVVGDKLDRFKQVIRGVIKTPEPVNPQAIPKERARVKKVRKEVENLITKVAKFYEMCMEKKTSSNWALPKTFAAIDTIKKVIVDTLNLCDQDLNLLSLVDRVYYRKIYESDISHILADDNIDDIMECEITNVPDDIFEAALNEYMDGCIYEKSSADEDKIKADLNEVINDLPSKNEDYYPIFPMSVAYNYGPMYTFMAPIIHKITNGDEYTHSFMSFDPEFKKIATFGGKGLEYMTVEDYEAFKYSKSVYISVVWLTKDEMTDVKKTLKDYNDNPKDVRFSLINFFSMMLGKIKRKDKSHCCSAFLGYLLNVANKKNLTKDYSQTRPEDITLLPRAFYVGTFKDLEDLKKKRPELKRRIDKIYEDNIDDIREYNNAIPRVMLTDNIKKPKHLKEFFKRFASE